MRELQLVLRDADVHNPTGERGELHRPDHALVVPRGVDHDVGEPAVVEATHRGFVRFIPTKEDRARDMHLFPDEGESTLVDVRDEHPRPAQPGELHAPTTQSVRLR